MQVMTSQEIEIKLSFIETVKKENEKIIAYHANVKPDKNTLPIINKSRLQLQQTLFA